MSEHSDSGSRPCVCCFELPRVEAERDRLRDELDAVRSQYEAHVRMLTKALTALGGSGETDP